LLLISLPDVLSCYNALPLFSVAPTLEQRASVKRFVSFQFLNPKAVVTVPSTGDQPFSRPLPTQSNKNTGGGERRQTSTAWMGFEHTIPAFERAKTVHALGRAAGHWYWHGTAIIWNKTLVIKQVVLPEQEAGKTVPSLFSSVQLEVYYSQSGS
jgi:hypothetical protein